MGDKPEGYPVFEAELREDGKTSNIFGVPGARQHGHAVVNESGELSYLRDVDGDVLYDDSEEDE